MTKRKRRTCLAIFALAMCMILTVAALAEGALSSIYGAGCTLLFDTDNVTLSAKATFAYDGELFKTFEGRYVQDGFNSLMDLMLKTPQADGSEKESGYLVVANGQSVYSIDRLYSDYYADSICSASDSVLTSTALRQSITRLGKAFLELAEDTMSSAVTTEQTDQGTQHTISLHSGESPRIADSLLTVLAQVAIRRYFYITPAEPSDEEELTIFYQDSQALRAHAYQALFNQPMPERFWSLPNANTINTQINQYITQTYLQPLYDKYSSGYAVICGDGASYYYTTFDEALIATGEYRTYFENTDATFRAWYQQNTGKTLTKEDMQVLRYTGNNTLKTAYDSMWTAMLDDYDAKARESGTAGIAIHADGSYSPIENLREYAELYGKTTTQLIVESMNSLSIDDLSVLVNMDHQGRITSASGSLRLLVADAKGESHSLEIVFEAEATDYDTSDVPPFDPASYGVISSSEYYQTTGIPLDILSVDTIEFNGVEYTTDFGAGNG